MPLRLAIVTPTGPIVDADVDVVVCPGSEGEFGVLPGHEPFMAPLGAGVVRYESGGRQSSVNVTGGFAEVTYERVVILADGVEPSRS